MPLAEQAIKEQHSHVRYLEALLAMECEERDRHAVANRIRDAQLPRLKTLEEFDFEKAPQIPAAKMRDLAQGGYIERSEPVVLIGECGTGKTHLATGLYLAACQQERRVGFVTAAALVNELIEAKQNGQVKRLMTRWMTLVIERIADDGSRGLTRSGRRDGDELGITGVGDKAAWLGDGVHETDRPAGSCAAAEEQ